ncbi:MAG: NEW3 domain-containing protein [Candidatus Eremiobacteraeota bacterium]|nr:NEW3 domain-containing protein [Candidatus Eremiobacteraeota bacterium]
MVLLVCGAGTAFSSGALSVRRSSPQAIQTDPGRIVTAAFQVKNTLGAALSPTETMKVPPGWQVVIPTGQPFRISAGEELVRFATVRIPAKAPAGRYELTYQVQASQAAEGSGTVEIEVNPLIRIEAQVEEKPEIVIAGDIYAIKLRVTNRGNVATAMGLELKNSPPFPLSAPVSRMTLDVGQSELITVTVKTEKSLVREEQNVVVMRLIVDESLKKNLVIERSASVKVLPRITGVYDPYHRLKCLVSLAEFNDNGQTGFQGEVSGAGSLDEAETRKIDFLFRSPDLQNFQWANREQYFMNYYTRTFEMHLGDQNYSLTPLTENFKYGRAAEVDFLGPRVEWGGYTLRTLLSQPQEEQTAAFMAYNASDRLYFQGTLLNKTRDTSVMPNNYLNNYVNAYLNGFFNGYISGQVIGFVTGYGYVNGEFEGYVNGTINCFVNGAMNGYFDDYSGAPPIGFIYGSGLPGSWNNARLYSILGNYEVKDKLKLQAEYAGCNSNSGGAAFDKAYHIVLNGAISQSINYAFEKCYAGPRYFGYMSDVDYTNASITFPILKELSGYGSYRFYQNNLSRDPTQSTANREETYQVGTAYTFPGGLSLSLDYNDFDRKDDFLPVDYNFRTRWWRWGLGQSFTRWGLQAYLEKGVLNENIINYEQPMTRTSLYAYYNPAPGLGLTLYLINGETTFYLNPQFGNTIGGSAQLAFSKNLKMTFNYEQYTIYDTMQQSQNYYGTVEYLFPDKSFLLMRARKRRSTNTFDDRGVMVTYNIPLGVPVSRKKDIAMIKGVVFDAEKEGVVPLANVVVKAGQAVAVSDGKGKYLFPALGPGEIYISVEKRSIGLRKVTKEKTPFAIKLKGGETKELPIGIITSAKISGNITIYGPPEDRGSGELLIPGKGEAPAPLVAKGGLSSALVEITNGNETVRQMTNGNGDFAFYDVRPGKWTLIVYDDELPELTYLETNNIEVEVAPGGEKTLALRILPRKRTIKIIDHGDVKKDQKKETRKK